MDIDFRTKKTEAEWTETFDAFWRKFIPLWFDWLGWVLILGAVKYLGEQTNSPILKLIYVLSNIGLFWYLNAVFSLFRFRGFRFIKSDAQRHLASLVLSGLSAYVVWWLLDRVVSQIQGQV